MVEIVVDKREPQKLRKRFREEMLQVGDYVVGNFVIERKKVNDFVNSYLNGRLKRQLVELCKVSDRPVLAIIGDFFKNYFFPAKKNKQKPISPTTFGSMLASLITSFPKLQIISLPNDTVFVRFLEKLKEKLEKGETVSELDVKLMSQQLPKDTNFMVRFFMLFDGVGVEKAKRLADSFKTLKALIRLRTRDLKKELMKVDGVGDKLAEKIVKALGE
jgi:ERCC4-type nuclease